MAKENRFLVDRTVQHIGEQLFQFLKLLGLKTIRAFNGAEIARNSNLYAYREESIVLRSLLWKRFVSFPSGILPPLGLLGIWFERSRWRLHLLLFGRLGALAAFLLVFFVTALYRIPALAVLAIFAALAIKVLIDDFRKRRDPPSGWPFRGGASDTPGFSTGVQSPGRSSKAVGVVGSQGSGHRRFRRFLEDRTRRSGGS